MADKKTFFLDLINACAESEALESPARLLLFHFYLLWFFPVRVWIWFLLPLNLSTLYFVCQRACMHMRAHAYMHTHAELVHSWLRLWPLTGERCPTFRIFCQPASDTEQTSNSPFKPGTVTICTKLQPHLELT